MQPISSWSKRGGALPSVPPPPPPKNTNFGFDKLQKAPFQALDFAIFLGSMTPDPCKAHKRMIAPAVMCIKKNIVNTLASIAESNTAHPNEMSANAYFMLRSMYTCMCTASKCINSRCSCARRQMGCFYLLIGLYGSFKHGSSLFYWIANILICYFYVCYMSRAQYRVSYLKWQTLSH